MERWFRGTTPRHWFDVPFSKNEFTVINIAYAQARKVVLEKTLTDIKFLPAETGCRLELHLTQEDTLKFRDGIEVECQIRACVNGEWIACDIMTASVERILRDGVLE